MIHNQSYSSLVTTVQLSQTLCPFGVLVEHWEIYQHWDQEMNWAQFGDEFGFSSFKDNFNFGTKSPPLQAIKCRTTNKVTWGGDPLQTDQHNIQNIRDAPPHQLDNGFTKEIGHKLFQLSV